MSTHINQQISAANKKVVLALAGGGYGLLGKLARPGGLSSTIMEAAVLSHTDSFIAFNHGKPDRFVSGDAACSLAMAAYKRCLAYAPPEQAIGFASTASLAKATWEEERQGRQHHCNVAIQTSKETISFYIKFGENRHRLQEEMVLEDCLYRLFLGGVARRHIEDKSELLLNALTLRDSLEWEVGNLLENDVWGDIYGVIHNKQMTTCGDYRPKAILSSSLNPIHEGHIAIINHAAQKLGNPIDIELCVSNADKPALDYISLNRRLNRTRLALKGNPNFGRIIISNTATYFEKSAAYPGATFIVGDDTLARIAMVKYYKGGETEYADGLKTLRQNDNGFLVYPRPHNIQASPIHRLLLQPLVVMADDFNPINISSTEIRKVKNNAG